MIGLADIDSKLINDVVAENIRNSFHELCNNKQFDRAISSGTNGKGAIKTRVLMAKEKFESQIHPHD
jgi:hypothetical protein